MKLKTSFKILLSCIFVFLVGIMLTFSKIYSLSEENKELLKKIEDNAAEQKEQSVLECSNETLVVYDVNSLRTALDRATSYVLDEEQ